MRGRQIPPEEKTPTANAATKIDYQTAVKLLNGVDNEIDNVGYRRGLKVGSFKTKFDSSIAPTDLKGLSPEEAYILIDQKLRAANEAVDKYSYFSAEKPINAAEVSQAAQSLITEFINGIVTAAAGASLEAVNGPKGTPYQAPDDVSCSISVMSWQETNDVFGRRVANQFVALQVTVRNLNTRNEFLIHDIQVAVDTGVTPDYFGRFQAGRDKLLVRAVAQRGATEDKRNLIFNALQSLGSIAGASSITAGTVEFKDAVAVFQGAFLQGYSNVFPDHTIEQLNHINDLVFSASNSSKVVVPIQGAVPLVTFIAAKPIEELPFAWCGYQHQSEEKDANFHFKRWFGLQKDTGHCFYDKRLPDNDHPYNDEMQYNSSAPWDDLPYKKWKPAALRMLQDHTYVVIGGVHIQEVTSQPKAAAAPVCPTLSNGAIDISEAKDGMVNCTMAGSGLTSVSFITLERGATKIPGTIKSAADGNSAALQFDPNKLYDNEGNYSLRLTYKSGSQSEPIDADSGELVLLAKQPILTSAGSLDLSKVTTSVPATVALQGKNLDKLTSISLAVEGGTAELVTTTKFAPHTSTAATATFDLSTLLKAGLDASKKYHVVYGLSADPAKQVDAKTITVTVENKLSAAPKAPAARARVGGH